MSNKITISDIARETNLSKATVSYILNGKHAHMRISDATVARVLAVCRELGYRPDEAAVALANRRQLPLNMLVLSPWLYSQNSDFMSQLYGAFKAASVERGMHITFMPYECGALSKTLRASRVKKYDALVLIGTDAGDEEWAARHGQEFEGRLIALNRLIASEHVSSVCGNDYEAQRSLVGAVAASGQYSSYVVVNEGAERSRCRAERIRALRETLAPYDTVELACAPPEALLKAFGRPPEGVCFCFSMYHSASLFLTTLHHAGVDIPCSCGVTAYDVHTLLTPYLPLPMTTVDPRVPEMAAQVCDIAFALREGGAPCQRVVRAVPVPGGSAVTQWPENRI